MQNKPIEIKISTVVAISVVLHELDDAVLSAALQEMTGGAPDFFENEFAVIDVGALDGSALASIDWQRLVTRLKSVNLNPVAVRNAPAGFHASIIEQGLSVDETRPNPEKASAHAHEHVREAQHNAHLDEDETPAEPVAVAAPAPEPVAPATPPVEHLTPSAMTMIIDTPVRAGQRIYARGADLIITAVVNNGAEVIADGSIHIYAQLKGRALAGASGNPNARIFAMAMTPELLSINGMYRTFEDGFPANLANAPVQARLIGDRLDLTAIPPATKNT